MDNPNQALPISADAERLYEQAQNEGHLPMNCPALIYLELLAAGLIYPGGALKELRQ